MYDPDYRLYEAGYATWDEMFASIDAELGADRQLKVTVPVMMVGRPDLDLRRYVEGKSRALDKNAFSIGANPELTVTMDGKRSPVFVPEISRDDKRGKAAFVVAKGMQVCIGATYERGRFTVSVLSPFIRLLYPGLSMAFLSSEDIQSALDAFDGAGHGDVIVDSYACRSKLGDERSRVIRTTESTMRRTDKPYREVFETAEGSIDRIQFRLIESGKSVMDGDISRSGVLRFRRSLLPFSGAMRQIAKTVSSKTLMYSNRSRLENGGKMRPLVIEVADSPFRDRAEGERLISTIRSMGQTSSSLYHSGPYIHMFLVDFRDGSTFDIWVVSDGEVTVVPQIRATAAAVARLTAHIMKEFKEGRVREHEQSEW